MADQLMLVATWYEKELKACPEKIFLKFRHWD